MLSDGTGWNGCYASHILLRKGTHVAKLPDNVPSRIAAPLNCALATMVNAVSPVVDLDNLEKRRKLNNKKTVLIQVNTFINIELFHLLWKTQQSLSCWGDDFRLSIDLCSDLVVTVYLS